MSPKSRQLVRMARGRTSDRLQMISWIRSTKLATEYGL
jgi:hypothetical protein